MGDFHENPHDDDTRKSQDSVIEVCKLYYCLSLPGTGRSTWDITVRFLKLPCDRV